MTVIRRKSAATRWVWMAAGLIGSSSLSCGRISTGKTRETLRMIETIPLPLLSGRLNDMDFDSTTNRLYVAAPDDDRVVIIDLASRAVIKVLKNLKNPEAVLAAPLQHKIVISDASRNTLEFYDSDTWQHRSTLQGIPGVRGLLMGSKPNRAYVGFGHGTVGILAMDLEKMTGQVALKAKPAFFQIERNGSLLFVNVPPNSIEVVDRFRDKVIGSWTFTGLIPPENYVMDLDEEHQRLFVAQRLPPQLVILDSKTGRVIATLPCADDAGDVFFDQQKSRIYVIGGASRISVVQQIDPDHYGLLEELRTRRGARKCIFDPRRGRLYVGFPKYFWRSAEVRIYKTGDGGS